MMQTKLSKKYQSTFFVLISSFIILFYVEIEIDFGFSLFYVDKTLSVASIIIIIIGKRAHVLAGDHSQSFDLRINFSLKCFNKPCSQCHLNIGSGRTLAQAPSIRRPRKGPNWLFEWCQFALVLKVYYQ